MRAQLGVRDLLGQRRRARDNHRGPGGQRVERGHPQADEVRGRREVRFVADAARRVEAHDARAEEGLEVGGEVARGAVVARHYERRLVRARVEQRGEQVRAKAGRYEGPLASVPTVRRGIGELLDLGVLVGVGEERAKRHRSNRL